MRPAPKRQIFGGVGRPSLKILGLDTACGACSAAVCSDGAVAARRFELRARGHAEALMPMVQAVMDEAAITYDALDAIAVTRGPGTFTGLRIGLAAARGLALAAGRPLVGLTTLEVIAAAAADDHPDLPILAAIDARRGQVYAQMFRPGGTSDREPRALSLEAAADLSAGGRIALAGNMAGALKELLDGDAVIAAGTEQPDAAVLAQRVAASPLPAPGVTVTPLYLRAPDAILPNYGKRNGTEA